MTEINKKKKFVANGLFKAEITELLTRHLCHVGYSGSDIRMADNKIEIIIYAVKVNDLIGPNGIRTEELSALIRRRFNLEEGTLHIYAADVENRSLSAIAQCEAIRLKLLGGTVVRKACHASIRGAIESGAMGVEVIVSGKIRGQRAKAMKFTDGFMVHSGQPAKDLTRSATRHCLLRQGVLGIKVTIMLPQITKDGKPIALPDTVIISPPDDDDCISANVPFPAFLTEVQGASEAEPMSVAAV